MLKKQIVFCDYDGTIYINEQDMEKNIKCIEEYRNFGGIFVIVTGRSKTSVYGVIEKYNIQYDYIIANNGAVIFDNVGNKIYEQTIKNKDSTTIIEYLKLKPNTEIFYYDENDKVKYEHQELLKIRAKTCEIESAKDIEQEVNSLFKDSVIAFADFSYSIVEIVSKKAGKEKTIKQLLNILNMRSEQAITIGDGRNDISMIKEYNGYSMENADDEAKKVASKIFKSVGEMLEYLKL